MKKRKKNKKIKSEGMPPPCSLYWIRGKKKESEKRTMQRIIKQNNKYNLVFEQNETTGMAGVYVIETRKHNNMIYNFAEELEAIKQFNEMTAEKQ